MAILVAGSTAIDPALVARFRQALDRLNPDGGKIGLAVSGGPDSMAMLLLALEAIPGGFEVATVDHGLRPEAKEECALVVAACEARGVPCEVLTVQVGEGNLQQEARFARYRAFSDWCKVRKLEAIATAHHADDQAETLIMRLNRGSGLSGLAGVRPRSLFSETTIIRPLLDWRREDLGLICRSAGIAWVKDPSNQNLRFERVAVRKAIAKSDWLDPQAVAKSAEFLAEAEDFIERELYHIWNLDVVFVEDGAEFMPAPSRFACCEIVSKILAQMGVNASRSDVARMVDRLGAGQNASLGGVLGKVVPQAGLEEQGRLWIFRAEPPRRVG